MAAVHSLPLNTFLNPTQRHSDQDFVFISERRLKIIKRFSSALERLKGNIYWLFNKAGQNHQKIFSEKNKGINSLSKRNMALAPYFAPEDISLPDDQEEERIKNLFSQEFISYRENTYEGVVYGTINDILQFLENKKIETPISALTFVLKFLYKKGVIGENNGEYTLQLRSLENLDTREIQILQKLVNALNKPKKGNKVSRFFQRLKKIRHFNALYTKEKELKTSYKELKTSLREAHSTHERRCQTFKKIERFCKRFQYTDQQLEHFYEDPKVREGIKKFREKMMELLENIKKRERKPEAATNTFKSVCYFDDNGESFDAPCTPTLKPPIYISPTSEIEIYPSLIIDGSAFEGIVIETKYLGQADGAQEPKIEVTLKYKRQKREGISTTADILFWKSFSWWQAAFVIASGSSYFIIMAAIPTLVIAWPLFIILSLAFFVLSYFLEGKVRAGGGFSLGFHTGHSEGKAPAFQSILTLTQFEDFVEDFFRPSNLLEAEPKQESLEKYHKGYTSMRVVRGDVKWTVAPVVLAIQGGVEPFGINLSQGIKLETVEYHRLSTNRRYTYDAVRPILENGNVAEIEYVRGCFSGKTIDSNWEFGHLTFMAEASFLNYQRSLTQAEQKNDRAGHSLRGQEQAKIYAIEKDKLSLKASAERRCAYLTPDEFCSFLEEKSDVENLTSLVNDLFQKAKKKDFIKKLFQQEEKDEEKDARLKLRNRGYYTNELRSPLSQEGQKEEEYIQEYNVNYEKYKLNHLIDENDGMFFLEEAGQEVYEETTVPAFKIKLFSKGWGKPIKRGIIHVQDGILNQDLRDKIGHLKNIELKTF